MLCDGPGADWEDGGGRPAVLSPDRSAGGLLVLEEGEKGEFRRIGLDVVLPVLHGRLGEGGAMQGLLELSGIPYAGCDLSSAALCMDKSLAYTVARSAGIATPDFWTVTASGNAEDADNAGDIEGTGDTGDTEDIDAGRFTYPVFVKPARSGSSFGVSKVSRA
jgi:D-alanine--(R)-lactate ligase